MESISFSPYSNELINRKVHERTTIKLFNERGGIVTGNSLLYQPLRESVWKDTINPIYLIPRRVYTIESFIKLENYSLNKSNVINDINLPLWWLKWKSYNLIGLWHFHLSPNPQPSDTDNEQMKQLVKTLQQPLLLFIFAGADLFTVTHYSADND